jgi:hypothetical protein
MNTNKAKEAIFDEIILKLGNTYQEYGLTYGEIDELLDYAKEQVQLYIRDQKFKRS